MNPNVIAGTVRNKKALSLSFTAAIILLAVAFTLVLGGCGGEEVERSLTDPASDLPPLVAAVDSEFAPYRLEPVTTTPSIEHPSIAPDLSNVKVKMTLSPAQRERLAADGFVVSPGRQEKEFFTIYEKARYDNIPIFVTSDSLLHVFHLLFSKTLRTAEAEYFYPLLKGLNEALAEELSVYYGELKGGSWELPARHALAFVSLGGRLADPQFTVPAEVKDLVEAELALIEDAGGLNPSPIFPGYIMGEDYSQYIPRGHYTKSDALKAYFKNMMWYGRMTFRLFDEDETRSALLLVRALRHTHVFERTALETWSDLYNPTAFLVGRSDDLTIFDYLPLVDQVFGIDPSLTDLTAEDKLKSFIEAIEALPPQQILGLSLTGIEPELALDKGLRFMGQRFVPDAYIFTNLTYDRVSDFEYRRGLPMGLDLMAAMGSERAYQLLDQLGETEYKGYPEKMEKMRQWTASLTMAEWTETVNNAWLYSFYPLLEPPGEGYPAFMRSTAWLDKQLHTALGSWAELKHDTILYAKQSYAELGGGWAPTPPDPLPARGYVEPVPDFYARVAALAGMTREGLASRDLLNDRDAESLQAIETLALDLKKMAEKQLTGVPLTEEEHYQIRYYGGQLEYLVMAAADLPEEQAGSPGYMDDEPQAAVIADVANDLVYNGPDFSGQAVLEVGVGRINEIHVIVPLVEDDGTLTLQVTKGGVFSYYEFPWPAADRLTDEKWQQMLDEGSAPEPPGWINSFFTPESEDYDLYSSLYLFQQALVDALFFVDDSYLKSDYNHMADEAALEAIRADIAILKPQKQFEGRQLVGSDYRSYDRQAADLAVVTVRETWQDTLYRYEQDRHPLYTEDESDMIEIGRRGPYTLAITYTLKRNETGNWVVIRMVTEDIKPQWEKVD
jgi:hypothetical protein